MARLLAAKGWAPKSPEKEAKPARRVWPPPERKERGLGKLGDIVSLKRLSVSQKGSIVSPEAK